MASDIEESWRPLDRGQVTAWADLLAAVEATDHEDESFSESDLLDEFEDPAHDFEHGSVAVYDAGQMIAYCLLRAQDDPQGAHRMFQHGAVRPGSRGLGLGSRLFAWAERAAIRLHGEQHPGLPLLLDGTCLARSAEAGALFAGHGYQPARWFHRMIRDLAGDLPPSRPPADVTVTPLLAPRSADARAVRNEAFRDHWGSTEMTPAAWDHFLSYAAFRPGCSFLAYLGGEPVSVVVGQEYDAHTAATGRRDLYIPLVGTRRSGRGQGIASALLARAMRAARDDGFATATLDVDADSPTGAVGLYQRLGFTPLDTWITHRKSMIT